jgi:hypothetical protein
LKAGADVPPDYVDPGIEGPAEPDDDEEELPVRPVVFKEKEESKRETDWHPETKKAEPHKPDHHKPEPPKPEPPKPSQKLDRIINPLPGH